MSKEIKVLKPMVCRITDIAFCPPFSIDRVLSGLHVEAQCPAGNYVAIESSGVGKGTKICMHCEDCKSEVIS